MDTLKILQINVNHDIRAQDAVLALAARENVDVILISEPYTRNLVPPIQAPGWTIFWKERTAALVRHGITGTEDNIPHPDAVCIKILGHRIVGVYAPPNGDLHGMLQDISNLLDTTPLPSVIAGDFNGSTHLIAGAQTNPRGRLLEEFILNNELNLLNNGTPTWTRNFQNRILSATLDYTLCTSDVTPLGWRVLREDSLSDHHYILFSLETREPNTKRSNFFKLDLETLNNVLKELVIDVIEADSSTAEIDSYIENLQTLLQQAAAQATTIEVLPSMIKWWTPDLQKWKKLLTRIGYRLQRTRDEITCICLQVLRKTVRRVYKAAIKKAKEDSWRKFCSDTKLWGKPYIAMKKKTFGCQPHSSSLPPVLGPDGLAFASPEETAAFLVAEKFPDDPDPEELLRLPLAGSEGPPDVITKEEVAEIIRSTNNKKAPGPDGISNKVLKAFNLHHEEVLAALFNTCLRQQYFPSAWKTGKVVLIPKPGKDASTADGYRPITLLSTMGKAYENTIKRRLDSFMDAYNSLHPKQYGFRRGRSTEEALNDAIDKIKEMRKAKKITAVISLDIKGAFDHARWPVILQRCAALGMPWFLVATLRSYFTNRSVQLAGTSRILQRGCPQGSVLGPVLWNIAFDDILRIFAEDDSLSSPRIQCFADDTLMIIPAADSVELDINTAVATSSVIIFLERCGLQLNVRKTEAIIIDDRARKVKGPDPCDSVLIGETRVATQQSLLYLGVVVDERLNWIPHLQYILGKAEKFLPVFTAISHNVYGYSSWARRIMYQATVGSLLRYCSSVFFHQLKRKVIATRLRRLERTMALNIGRLYKRTSLDAARVIANVPPLDITIQHRSIVWLCQHGRLPLPSVLVAAIERNATHHTQQHSPIRGLKELLNDRTLRVWQERWETAEHGAWTRTLIPSVTNRAPLRLDLDFWLSQALSGKGCFGSFLCNEVKLQPTAACNSCGYSLESPEHVLVECRAFADIRPADVSTVRDLQVDNVVHLNFMRTAVRRLWDLEQSRQRPSAFAIAPRRQS